MSVKSFKFVSPGVFINEIDDSFIPKSAPDIGPVVIGRATRGLAMQPVTVESYSDFVQNFGDTVPGGAGGDVSRYGNFQSPMYGTYAAKAFLNADVSSLTYVRLLGTQDANAAADGIAGWQTTKSPSYTPTAHIHENGGAWGLWIWPSGSGRLIGGSVANNTGTLAAVWFLDKSASIALSGAAGPACGKGPTECKGGAGEDIMDGYCAGIGKVLPTDSNGRFTVVISSSLQGKRKFNFGFDDSDAQFIRKKFNTNPQLTTTPGAFYPSASARHYWLGPSFEQEIRDNSLVGALKHGVILPIALTSSAGTGTKGYNYMRQATREAVAGWFIGQDLETAATYQPENMQKLFRLKGRGHGEWLDRNVKVSIENLKASNSSATDYGTFSVVLRSLGDTDNNVVVLERWDRLSMDPTSPDYVARRIGDKFTKWDTTTRRLKTYGDYANQSKFVYVEMDESAKGAATDATLLPFGFYGPPKYAHLGGSHTKSLYGKDSPFSSSFLVSGTANGSAPATGVRVYIEPAPSTSYPMLKANPIFWPAGKSLLNATSSCFLSGGAQLIGPIGPGWSKAAGSAASASLGNMTASLGFPQVRLRNSASDGGLSDPTNAYFGMANTRTATSTRADVSVPDFHRLLFADFPDDPTTVSRFDTSLSGAMAYSYIFSMDNVRTDADGAYYYQSGSRAAGNSTTAGASGYTTLLDAGYDRFTAPFWGAFDGLDIQLPDPMYNDGIPAAASDTNSYEYYTIKRAIDTVADPEYIDMNLISMPGLTHNNLTSHMISVAEERGDALALIDLPDVYIPAHEQYKNSWVDRIGTTPTSAANTLISRALDSSYGCTFYPWVQTRDAATGRLLWIPPSVAMLGVLASSHKASQVWFAPAGFNRGGLTDGAAGIPITGVTERLVSKDRDTLYEARINPIASFPSTGIVVFGQKTLQERASALDRINVRRLVIYLKKQISILSTQVLFEQNVESTWNRFKALIEPFLANVKTEYGITEYKLILDSTTTTDDLIDQNILYAKIMVKPARAIEYIAIDFVISSTGASFDD